MYNVIITGATGMVGGIVLNECLSHPNVEKVISLARRQTGNEHDKLEEIVVEDFGNFSPIETKFTNLDIAFYCLGVYTGQVPDDKL